MTLQDACCAYAALRKDSDSVSSVDQINTVLARYSEVWRSGSIFQNDSSDIPPGSVDSSTTSLRPGKRILLRYDAPFREDSNGPWTAVRRAAALPFFARLNYHRQLSTTSIGLDIDATHNRLAHMLGTLDVASFMLSTFCNTITDESCLPTHAQAISTLFFALIHDAFHGPLGHSLDRISDLVLFDKQPSRIDKYFLLEQIHEAKQKRGGVWDSLLCLCKWALESDPPSWPLRCEIAAKAGRTPDALAATAVDFLEYLVDERRLATDYPKKFWLREIVDSALDADRFDYLMRDTYELRYGQVVKADQVRQLIQRARVLEATFDLVQGANGEVRGAPVNVYRIHWHIDTKAKIEELLSIRSSLYMEIYESPDKRVFDEMVSHALVWLLRTEVQLCPKTQWSVDENVSKILQSLARITDDELFHFLYEIGTQDRNRLSISLIHDVTTGRPFQEVWRFGIERERLNAARERMVSISKAWQAVEMDLSTKEAEKRGELTILHINRSLPLSLLFDGLQSGRDAHSLNDWDGLVYLMEVLHGRSFASRQELERVLWSRLLKGGGNRKLQQTITSSIREIAKRLVWPCSSDRAIEDMTTALQETPLLFLSIPWVPKVDSAPESMNWDKQNELVLHRDGKACESPWDPAERHHQQLFPVSLYLPGFLADQQEVRDLASELACKLIWSGAFYRPSDLLPGNAKLPFTRWESVDIGDIQSKTQITLE